MINFTVLKTLSLVVYFTVVYLSKASISLLLPNSLNTSANSASAEFWSLIRRFSVTLFTSHGKIFCGTESMCDVPLWFSNHAQGTTSAAACTSECFGQKGRQQAFVGRAWARACWVPSSLSCAVALPRLRRVCWKTTAAFLRTSPTALWASRCPPRRSQSICLSAEIRCTFRRSLAFAANAQLPSCRTASRPKLCLGAVRWRLNQDHFDTSSRHGICANGLSLCPPHAFVTCPGPDIVADVQKLEHRCGHVHDHVLFLGHFHTS